MYILPTDSKYDVEVYHGESQLHFFVAKRAFPVEGHVRLPMGASDWSFPSKHSPTALALRRLCFYLRLLFRHHLPGNLHSPAVIFN